MKAGRDFNGLLGFQEVMDMGWVVTLASPSNPTAQPVRDPSGRVVNVLTHRDQRPGP